MKAAFASCLNGGLCCSSLQCSRRKVCSSAQGCGGLPGQAPFRGRKPGVRHPCRPGRLHTLASLNLLAALHRFSELQRHAILWAVGLASMLFVATPDIWGGKHISVQNKIRSKKGSCITGC